MSNETPNRYPGAYRKYWVLAPLFFLGIALVLGWAVQFLWNNIVPEVTGWKSLSYTQALGLFVLCRILFGGFRGGGPGYKRSFAAKKAHWMNMSEEERARFKANWAERCAPKTQSGEQKEA